jgi:hypothetical protein
MDIPRQLVSVLDPFVKPQSQGTEVYHMDEKMAPIHQAVPKLESKAQVRLSAGLVCHYCVHCVAALLTRSTSRHPSPSQFFHNTVVANVN